MCPEELLVEVLRGDFEDEGLEATFGIFTRLYTDSSNRSEPAL